MNKESGLLHLLEEKDRILSANELSETLNVSTRTIRNYIKRINNLQEDNVILSTNKGYFLNKALYETAKNQLKDEAQKTAEERVEFLIGAILRQDKNCDLLDLALDLGVSDKTVILDLAKVESIIKQYNLSLHREKQDVWISGSERKKRSLIRKIYSKEVQDQMYYFFAYQDILTDEQVAFLRGLLLEKLNEHKIEMNDFSLSNVLLHLMIAIARIRDNQAIEENETNLQENDSAEYLIAKEVFDETEKVFGIVGNSEEILALKLLLIGNTMKKESSMSISSEVERLTDCIIQEVNRVYLIDLNDEGFAVRFSIHLENLIKRRRNEITNPNPMLELLQKGHPMVYDMALLISHLIEEDTGLKIPEEEVAYISLHIGSYMNEKEEQEGVTATIIAPNYNNAKKQVSERLESHLENSLIIKNIVTTYVQVSQQFPTDIIISTVPYKGTPGQEIVFVTPFFGTAEIKKVEATIAKIERNKRIEHYQQLTDTYFCNNAFFTKIFLKTKEEYINYIGNNLVQEGIVTEEYVSSVIDRENMAPTLLDEVAIPHSLYRTATRSMFAVLVNKEKIVWGNGKAKIVLFMVVNNEDQEIFNDFLQMLIRILSEPANLNQLMLTPDFEKFKTKIKQLIREYFESE